MDEDSVSFRVRDWAHDNRWRTLRLPAETFIDRFLLHVLPKGSSASAITRCWDQRAKRSSWLILDGGAIGRTSQEGGQLTNGEYSLP